ncbi:hypothetical protein [Paraburkholderia sp.]|uniref:hypothetical protein n=1 Tax=Paraburkholderia sp. TaxID=1926495 RepID=UPI003C7BF928
METNDLIRQLGETVAAPVNALQIAFVHLVQQLDNAGRIDKKVLASQLEACAKVQEPTVMNAEAIARHLYALAQQIREATTTSGPSKLQ